jgi:hypothetical protein
MGRVKIQGMKTIAPKDPKYARNRVVVNLPEFQAFAEECIANGRCTDAIDQDKNPILNKDGTQGKTLWFDLKESQEGDLYFQMWHPDAAPAPKPVAAPEPMAAPEDIPF